MLSRVTCLRRHVKFNSVLHNLLLNHSSRSFPTVFAIPNSSTSRYFTSRPTSAEPSQQYEELATKDQLYGGRHIHWDTFEDLDLHPVLRQNIHDLGFTHQTPVQMKSLHEVNHSPSLIILSSTSFI